MMKLFYIVAIKCAHFHSICGTEKCSEWIMQIFAIELDVLDNTIADFLIFWNERLKFANSDNVGNEKL